METRDEKGHNCKIMNDINRANFRRDPGKILVPGNLGEKDC